MEIIYKDSIESITEEMLEGFFVDWPNPPSRETHLKLLENSDFVVLAIDEANGEKVVGFITAISDKTLSAFIPFLEVLPEYQNKGVGGELVNKMMEKLKDFYMIDLLCDEDMQNYYEKFNMKKATGMMIRNFDKQSGK